MPTVLRKGPYRLYFHSHEAELQEAWDGFFGS